MKNEKKTKGTIKYSSKNKELLSKIKSTVVEQEKIFWYLKFNLKLLPESINKDTMYVTDLGGFIMDTKITYRDRDNLIEIAPEDSYEDEAYYLLNITKNIKSESGNNLKKKITILFKLSESKICRVDTLPQESEIPKPKVRPPNYNGKNVVSKVTCLPEHAIKGKKQDKLPYAPVRVNVVILIISLLVLPYTLKEENQQFLIYNLGLMILGIFIIVIQSFRKECKSNITYNIGVVFFNFKFYKIAKKKFIKAFKINNNNERAEIATGKIEYYI